MQVISLEGCPSFLFAYMYILINNVSMLQGILHLQLRLVYSLESLQLSEQRGYSARMLLAERPQVVRVSTNDPLV